MLKCKILNFFLTFLSSTGNVYCEKSPIMQRELHHADGEGARELQQPSQIRQGRAEKKTNADTDPGAISANTDPN